MLLCFLKILFKILKFCLLKMKVFSLLFWGDKLVNGIWLLLINGLFVDSIMVVLLEYVLLLIDNW